MQRVIKSRYFQMSMRLRNGAILKPVSSLFIVLVVQAAAAALPAPQQTKSAQHACNKGTVIRESLDDAIVPVISSDAIVGRARLTIDKNEQTLSVDIRPLPLGYIGHFDVPFATTLEEAVRIKVLRRDLEKNLGNETFWKKQVENVTDAIDCSLEDSSGGNAQSYSGKHAASNSVEAGFRKLLELITTYAARVNLAIEEARDPAPGFAVTVKFDPHPVRTVIMPYLAYLICKKKNLPLENQWREISEGPQKMIGKYEYLTDWPSELGGRVEGTFEVLEDGDVFIFRPQKQK